MRFMEELTERLGSENVLSDLESLKTYGRDWTKKIAPDPSAVVFPTTSDDLVFLVHWARQKKVPLVPSGGRTGLAGAALAPSQEVVVSFERMNKILDFSEEDLVVTCQPGVITQELQNFAAERGYYFPVDFAAKGSSEIGGNISTNAGGAKVIRYGMMRQWVRGLEVVTGAGERLRLGNGLIKNNTGYDLLQLFIGAEGTLGFITEAKIKLTKAPAPLQVLLLGIRELSHSMEVLREFQKSLSLTAFEFFSELALAYVREVMNLPAPLSTECSHYLLIEFEESESTMETAMDLFDRLSERQIILDGVASQSASQAAELWAYRENITESISKQSPHKTDVSVPISRIPEFVLELEIQVKAQLSHMEVVWFGHMGDGNLHINLLKPDSISVEEFEKQTSRANELIFSTVARYGGSISAEHGIGLLRKPYLHHSRSPEEINIMRAIKKVFDPDSVLNPGKIFDITD